VLAVCTYFNEPKAKCDFDSHFSFYLDDIRDPGNLGTIIRLADWFGMSTIFCSPNSCDFYNPKVIQSTMGAFLRVNVVYTELSDLIVQQNIKHVYGALLSGKNVYKEQLKNGLIVIGNEANGIQTDNLKLINQPITIPANKSNGTESLNAAMASSIIVSEFFRQLKMA
jgi:TrmH family RNA methyltransferase